MQFEILPIENSHEFKYLFNKILIQFLDGTWSLGENHGFHWLDKNLVIVEYKWEQYKNVFVLPK